MTTPDPAPGALERLLGEPAAARLRAALGQDRSSAEGPADPTRAQLREELRRLIDAGGADASEAGVVAVSAAEADADRALHERLDRELQVARRIQQRLVLVTGHQVEGWQTACEYQPAREIGGDFFDLFPLPGEPGRLGIVIADVSGKGISAALLMAFVRPVMRAALDRSGDPATALERTNTILATERQTGLFVTALAAIVYIATGSVRLANAGHEPPIRLAPDGAARPIDVPAAPLLGAFAELRATAHEVVLAEAESLVLYTDGVTDAANPAGERFGDERLMTTLAGAASRPADGIRSAVVDAVAAFRGPAEPADDLALLVLKRSSA